MKFDEYDLDENLRKGISDAGYVDCTEVQEKVLQKFAQGKCDLYVQSQTGTGKTAAYLVPILNECLKQPLDARKKVLVMLPTRELAVQVEEEAKLLCAHTDLKCASFFGGVDYERQIKKLRDGVDVLVGTPGRVIDLHKSGSMDLSNVGFLVVDEADRMFDMGFYPDLRELIKFLPPAQARQTMLFSATLNTYVKNLAWEYTVDAQEITIEAENITVSEIDQMLFHVASGDKMRLLLGILKNENPESVLIFCNTKKTCEIVSKRLAINGIENEFIIGDLAQKKRLSIIGSFKEKKLKILCATDVAARGIDVNDLAMVVNYDLPNEIENYVHRIGRTARAGKKGKAYTFCSERDVYDLPAIERYIEMQIPAQVAFEDQMADDASKDVFIKLDSEEREERFERRGGRRDFRDGGERGGRGARPVRNARENPRGNSENRQPRTEKRNIPRLDAKSLENLPFEERMKLYKQAYSAQPQGFSQRENKSGNGGRRERNNRNYANGRNRRQNQNFKQNARKNRREFDRRAQNPQTLAKKTEKKGFFAKLLSIFGK